MNKRNARDILLKACERFQKIAGESLGINFTWGGNLDIFGSSPFRQILETNKEDVWRSLAFQKRSYGYETTVK